MFLPSEYVPLRHTPVVWRTRYQSEEWQLLEGVRRHPSLDVPRSKVSPEILGI
jgi:hypothetical protein